MSKKYDELYKRWLDKPMSRRELLDSARKLGLGGVSAAFLLNTMGTRALAATSEFNWKAHKG
ncbi:MAG TPA: hypothetical protein VKA32_02405, partial [Gammaproteobacteria bacterium]|nr:hypothetical protein [Gammaproteobacteria bacterium]